MFEEVIKGARRPTWLVTPTMRFFIRRPSRLSASYAPRIAKSGGLYTEPTEIILHGVSKIGTIAQALGVHPDTVRRAIEVEQFHQAEQLRPSILDPYLPFVRQTLEQHPRLRATRLYQMIREPCTAHRKKPDMGMSGVGF